MSINALTPSALRTFIDTAYELAALYDDKTVAKPEYVPTTLCDLPRAAPGHTFDPVWEIGKTYLIRTVTMIDTGVLVAVTPTELVLKDAAWIADTNRFADALKTCDFKEVEPFPDGNVIIGRGAIIDAVQIAKAPREQK